MFVIGVDATIGIMLVKCQTVKPEISGCDFSLYSHALINWL